MDFLGGDMTLPHLMITKTASMDNDFALGNLTNIESPQIALDTAQDTAPNSTTSNAEHRHPLSGPEAEAFAPTADTPAPTDSYGTATGTLRGDDAYGWLYDDLEELALNATDDGDAVDWPSSPPPGLPHPPQYKHSYSSFEGSPAMSDYSYFEIPADGFEDDGSDDFNTDYPNNVTRSPSPEVPIGSPFAHTKFTFRYTVHGEQPPLSPRSTAPGDAVDPPGNDPSASARVGEAIMLAILRKEPAMLSHLEECLDLFVPFDDDPTPDSSPVTRTLPLPRESSRPSPRSEPFSPILSPEVAELILEYQNHREEEEKELRKKELVKRLNLNFNYTSGYPPFRPTRVFWPPPPAADDSGASSDASPPPSDTDTRVLLETEVTPEMQRVKEMADLRTRVRAIQGRKERNLIFYNSDVTVFPEPPPRPEDFPSPTYMELRLELSPDDPATPPSERAPALESERSANLFSFAPNMVTVKPGFQALVPRGGLFEFNRPVYAKPSGSKRRSSGEVGKPGQEQG